MNIGLIGKISFKTFQLDIFDAKQAADILDKNGQVMFLQQHRREYFKYNSFIAIML